MPQTGEDFYAKDSWTLKRKRLHSSASHITQKRFEKPHTCAACDHYSPWGFLLKCQLPIQVKLCHRGSCRNWRGSAVHRASTRLTYEVMLQDCMTCAFLNSHHVPRKKMQLSFLLEWIHYTSRNSNEVKTCYLLDYARRWKCKQADSKQLATGSVIAEKERQPKTKSMYRSSGWRRFEFIIQLRRLTELWSLICRNTDGQWPGLKVRFKMQRTKS